MAGTPENAIKSTENSREFLIKLAKERWGEDCYGDFNALSINELEALVEYGDPRAYWEKEYDESRSFFSDKRGNKSTGTAVLNDKKYQNWKDKSVALKLGGFSMKRSVQIASKGEEDEVEKKKRIIKEILQVLPVKYKNITKFILENDLSQLAELTREFYTPTIRKLLGPLVLKRAHEQGLFVQIREVTEDMNINRSKFLHYQKILEDEGFFDSSHKDPSHETLINAAFNVIWKLRDNDFIESDEVSSLQTEIKLLLERHSEVWLTRRNLDQVLALLAIRRLNPEIKTKELSIFLTETRRDASVLFKAVKSASNRVK